MTDYLKDLIYIPEQVQSGDFVLNLSSGLQESAITQTLHDYVVTPQLAACFEDALSFIKSTVESSQNRSKGAYLHGSFGSGKSHFMAVLHLLLQGNSEARAIDALAGSVAKHDSWLQRHNILLVPYHMIGEASIEAGVLGGYARHIAKLHPEAPVPGFYLSESLFRDATAMRQSMGDETFFAGLNAGAGEAEEDGWGEVASGWSASSFEAAMLADQSNPDRARLVGDLIGSLFTTYQQMASTQGGGYVDFDTGLRIMTEHAQALGYSAIVLFLDELILWLASRLSDQAFISSEIQKVVKLVEQSAPRALPMVGFIARQRDLREFVGDQYSGAEQEVLSDSLKYWEGRFHTIRLEDRNLPVIVEKRLLRPQNEAARLKLAQAFEQTAGMREEAFNTLLTSQGDRKMFQQLYPFSPALVQALVALSSALQRERTALKVMLMLLVQQRDTLTLGKVIPVGDLYDVIASEAQPFSEQMRWHFDNAKNLLQRRLIPLLEAEHGVSSDGLSALPADSPERINFNNDMRLLKTLLLAALVPEVESFKQLNSTRLAALNHGTIKSPIPGREAGSVLKKCRSWAGQVGEIKISDDGLSSIISIQLSGVDTDSILENAKVNDNAGNRRRLIRDMVFKAFGIEDHNQLFVQHEWYWRDSKRSVDVMFQNIWEITDNSQFEAGNEHWKLIVDFPFDEGNHTVSDDVARIQEYQNDDGQGQALCWLPYFFSERVKRDLGKLVVLQEILKSDDSYARACSHLSPQDRASARNLLENQRSQLRQQINEHLMAAYGVTSAQEGALDTAASLETQIVSLQPGFRPQLPNGSSMSQALTGLLDQALTYQYPAHPEFGTEIRTTDLNKVWEQLRQAMLAENGRIVVERPLRALLRQIAEPLGLGTSRESVFVFSTDWFQHLTREVATQGGSMTVAALREAMDKPQPRGLPVEVQNLLILLFAEQGHYAFQLHGGPYGEGTLKRIDDDCTLIKQAMADPEQWREALLTVSSLFEGVVPALQTANNQKKMQMVVQEGCVKLLPHCRGLEGEFAKRMPLLGLPLKGNRYDNAQRAVELLSEWSNLEGPALVQALATIEVPTTLPALARSMETAQTLTQSLQERNWRLLDSVWADATGAGAGIKSTLCKALQSDELAEPLATVLRKAEGDATALLTAAAKPVEPPPAHIEPSEPDVQRGRVVISRLERKALGADEARTLLREIESKLQEGATLDINYTITVEDKA